MHRRLALATASLICATSALALDLPPRTPGLWEIRMIFEGRNEPPNVMQHCIDARTDKLMNANFSGMASDTCQKQEPRVVGSMLVIDSVCKMGAATTTSQAVFSGNFNSSYDVAVTSTMSPAMPGMPQPSRMKIAAKWTGPCKPGQKPGNMILPGGMKVNVLEMPSRPGMPGQIQPAQAAPAMRPLAAPPQAQPLPDYAPTPRPRPPQAR